MRSLLLPFDTAVSYEPVIAVLAVPVEGQAWRPVLHPFEDAGGALAPAHTHGYQAVPHVAAGHFAQNRGRKFGARASQRMSQGDGPAVYVDFFNVEAGFFDDRQRLHAESFVQFNQADVVERQAGDSERFGNSHYRPDSHDFRRHAAGGEADETGHRLQAQLARLAVRHDDGGSRAVAGLGRIARRHRAAGVEHRLQLCERLDRGIGARPFVLCKNRPSDFGLPSIRSDPLDFEGHDLVVELAFGLRAQGVLMAAVREGVGILARYVVFALHALSG